LQKKGSSESLYIILKKLAEALKEEDSIYQKIQVVSFTEEVKTPNSFTIPTIYIAESFKRVPKLGLHDNKSISISRPRLRELREDPNNG
jgi:hypothetical protein